MTDRKLLCTMKKATAAFNYNQQITGHIGKLSKDRIVFIGKHPNDAGVFIGFQNEEGVQTQLRLSDEAMGMLMRLYQRNDPGKDTFPLKIETKWEVTVKETPTEPTPEASDG